VGEIAVRIFLTGASGFIGAHVLRALLAKRHTVTALIMPEDPMRRLNDAVGHFTVVRGLLNDPGTWRPTLHEFKPDGCIHLAWYAEPGKYLESPENIPSLTASITLLNALIGVECRQVVMAGTCAEYDTNYGYLREDTPSRPDTIYAAAKLACFLLAQQIAKNAKIHFAWGRIFYPYGPQEDELRVIPSVIRALQGGQVFPSTLGEQVRDYIHVEDVATAFCALVEQQSDGVFNISSGLPITIRELLQTVGNLIGRADLIKFGAHPCRAWEPSFICGDNKKLKEIGWAPHFTLEQGLRQTLQWWTTHSGQSVCKV
jgi:nucleoside-diphosphate-sugar epimerase